MKPFSLLLLAGLALAATEPASAGLHDDYDRLLRTYVHDEGVDYDAWHQNVEDMRALGAYLDELQALDPRELQPDLQLAYWIDLYNATTLDLVLRNYRRDGEPLNSIKDLGGLFSSPWKKKLVTVGGEELSLDDIENEVIRPRFQEPRIHFALNCAARSCPPLAAFAFTGEKLDAQLDAVVERALGQKAWLDASDCREEGGKLRLTRIFDWYGDDFGGRDGVLDFVERYRPALRPVLRTGECDVDYLDYDWSLNRARAARDGASAP